MRSFAVGLALAATVVMVAAECPNACSGHGSCGAYDMCTCYDGFMANDCSQRICPFDIAHVDSPKGDLDMDGSVTQATAYPYTLTTQMYPDGTSELFPYMADSAGTQLDDTAHYYMECSNKGTCDRTSGSCTCFVGYEGSACQRASCPNDCSGHGVCLTNRERASKDNGNIYELWDADVGLSCDCDAGYYDYDCSKRECPYGIDPLYVDDKNTARVSTYSITLVDSADITGATGSFRIKFYDVYGEDWITEPIDIGNATTAGKIGCETISHALEALPNDVIPGATVDCSVTAIVAGDDSATFKLAFTGNPGALKAPELITTDNVGRQTTFDSVSTSNALGAYMYDTGIIGEFYDYFTTDCSSAVTLANIGTGSAAFGAAQTVTMGSGYTLKKLKQCLGDSNDDDDDDVDIESWDHGTMSGVMVGQYPHLVRLVSTSPTDDYDGGVFSILYYNTVTENLKATTAVTPDSYYVFATDGVLERVWADVDTDGAFDETEDDMGTAYWTQYDNVIYTSHDFSCENAGTSGAAQVWYTDSDTNNCLEKGDYIVLPSSTWGDATFVASASSLTPEYNITGSVFSSDTAINRLTAAQANDNSAGFYQIMKISVADYGPTTNVTEDRYQIVLDRPVFWDGSATSDIIHRTTSTTVKHGIVQMFKFTPPSDNGYEYAAECSARGLCDASSGLCKCFTGYTNGPCDTQSALAV